MALNLPEQWLLIFFVANLVLSALIQALPEPDTTSSKGYVFTYKFLSLLISDFKSFAQKIPPPTITETTGAIVTKTTVDPTPEVQK
jgi:hypothetical protein